MKLLIKIPTRSRGASFFQRYLDYSTYPNTHFLISLDKDDTSTINDFDKYKDLPNVSIVVGVSKSKIDAVNRDIHQNWDVLVIGSDDMRPEIKGYDTEIMAHFDKPDLYLWSSDGHQDRICTIPIMDSQYYSRFGWVYFPEYRSFFCDNEQTEIATKLKKCKKVNVSYFKHLHPAWAKKGEALPMDDLYRKNDKHWKHDEALYKKRKQSIV